MIDLHTHLLPGVDDGSRTMDNSVRVLERFLVEVVREVACTPHLTASRAHEAPVDEYAAAARQLRHLVENYYAVIYMTEKLYGQMEKERTAYGEQPLPALPWAPLAAQVTLEGQTFDARARVGGQDLPLNGVGLRAVAWLNGYAAGLYLPQKSGSADAVLAMPGPKRLQLRMRARVNSSIRTAMEHEGFV